MPRIIHCVAITITSKWSQTTKKGPSKKCLHTAGQGKERQNLSYHSLSDVFYTKLSETPKSFSRKAIRNVRQKFSSENFDTPREQKVFWHRKQSPHPHAINVFSVRWKVFDICFAIRPSMDHQIFRLHQISNGNCSLFSGCLTANASTTMKWHLGQLKVASSTSFPSSSLVIEPLFSFINGPICALARLFFVC